MQVIYFRDDLGICPEGRKEVREATGRKPQDKDCAQQLADEASSFWGPADNDHYALRISCKAVAIFIHQLPPLVIENCPPPPACYACGQRGLLSLKEALRKNGSQEVDGEIVRAKGI